MLTTVCILFLTLLDPHGEEPNICIYLLITQASLKCRDRCRDREGEGKRWGRNTLLREIPNHLILFTDADTVPLN